MQRKKERTIGTTSGIIAMLLLGENHPLQAILVPRLQKQWSSAMKGLIATTIRDVITRAAVCFIRVVYNDAEHL